VHFILARLWLAGLAGLAWFILALSATLPVRRSNFCCSDGINFLKMGARSPAELARMGERLGIGVPDAKE